jgi:predicted O-methyltransferase YrrM
MSADTQLLLDASQSLNSLAKSIARAGDSEQADRFFQIAAEIELSSPELQQCWGGPFNGQAGRIAIMSELLRLLAPSTVIETGTFRGITTAWFARNFNGPIFTCELEKLYTIQAQKNVAKFSNVHIDSSDSRIFLRHRLKDIPVDDTVLIYLDAHWERDLPLREELAIIFGAHHNAVVVIDDFQVPFDHGYGWDDYGPGLALTVQILKGIIPDDALIFFPSLASEDDTGARRGCCVVAADAVVRLKECRLLRSGTLKEWMNIDHGEAPRAGHDASRSGNDEESMSYPKMIRSLQSEIESLRLHIDAIERDRAQHVADIHTLTAEIDAIERDRAQRLADVHTLTAEIDAIERDRAQRLADVHTLTAEIERLRSAADRVSNDSPRS